MFQSLIAWFDPSISLLPLELQKTVNWGENTLQKKISTDSNVMERVGGLTVN